MSKVAVMQPYFYPYIGYFQMIEMVDHFVFYNDVNFIKGGWLNRNRILAQGKPQFVNLPLSKPSSNKAISDTRIAIDDRSKKKIKNQVYQSYSNAPNRDSVMDIISSSLDKTYSFLDEYNIHAIMQVCDYLDIETSFHVSSESFPKQKDDTRVSRLLTIVKSLGGDKYINAIGGKDLYDKEMFSRHNIELSFVVSEGVNYSQNGKSFVENLSIIDVLMYNDIAKIKELLKCYRLE